MSRACNQGYKDVLTGKQVILKESEHIDENTTDRKQKLKNKKMNCLGYEELLASMSFKTQEGRLRSKLLKTVCPMTILTEMSMMHGTS